MTIHRPRRNQADAALAVDELDDDELSDDDEVDELSDDDEADDVVDVVLLLDEPRLSVR